MTITRIGKRANEGTKDNLLLSACLLVAHDHSTHFLVGSRPSGLKHFGTGRAKSSNPHVL